MTLPKIHLENRQWLAARLRAHSRCVFGIAAICAIIHAVPSVAIVPGAVDVPSPIVSVSESGKKLVMPAGWRRTKNGWEHVSTWHGFTPQPASSINDLIAQQHDQEPRWVRRVMMRISRIPPLMIALIQITAIAAIVFVAETRRRGK